MASSIRWIVFDLGGVVINVDFNNFFAALPSEYHASVAKNQPLLTSIFRDYEARSGEELPEQVFDTIRTVLNVPVTNQELIFAINSMLGAPKQEVCDAIVMLKKSYSVACLSNTNHIHWDYLLEQYPIMNHFEVQIASHIIGAAKPDAEIYHRAQARLQAQPEELLFFDDKPENVEAALALGWRAAVFQGFERFVEDCRYFGVSIEGA